MLRLLGVAATAKLGPAGGPPLVPAGPAGNSSGLSLMREMKVSSLGTAGSGVPQLHSTVRSGELVFWNASGVVGNANHGLGQGGVGGLVPGGSGGLGGGAVLDDVVSPTT